MISLVQRIVHIIGRLFHFIFSIINIPAILYDWIITRPMTKYTYKRFLEQIIPNISKTKRILDVGTGTGLGLEGIINSIPLSTQVVAIDIDEYYLKKAKQIFATRRNVEVRLQNFYALENANEKYDIVIFSGSFMLMPDQNKAIEIAKKMLNPGGRIYFLLTLYDKRKEALEKLKPLIKHYTTIDFGKITYEAEFDRLIKDNNLRVLTKERIFQKYNPLFHYFRIFIVESDIL